MDTLDFAAKVEDMAVEDDGSYRVELYDSAPDDWQAGHTVRDEDDYAVAYSVLRRRDEPEGTTTLWLKAV